MVVLTYLHDKYHSLFYAQSNVYGTR